MSPWRASMLGSHMEPRPDGAGLFASFTEGLLFWLGEAWGGRALGASNWGELTGSLDYRPEDLEVRLTGEAGQ